MSENMSQTYPRTVQPYSLGTINTITDDELAPLLDHSTQIIPVLNNATVIIYIRRWYILALFSMLEMTQGMIWGTWGAIAAAVEPAMGWGDGTISLLTNWGAITYIVSALFFAWLMDVKGLRWATVTCAFLVASGAILRCFTIQQPYASWLIHSGQILNGLGGPVAMGMPPLLSATWFPVNERTISTAIASACGGMGVTLSVLLGPYIVPELGNTTNSSSIEDMYNVKGNILNLMYIEGGIALAVLLLVLLYFPSRPPTPPSVTASITRVNFKTGFLTIIKNRQFWMLGGSYALSSGVFNCWTAVLNVNLKHIHISQSTSGYIAFAGSVAGNFFAVVISIFASKFARKMKKFLLVLYTTAVLAFLVFTLVCAGYIPHHTAILYMTMIVGSISIASSVPLLFELICENTYPVAEGLTNSLMTWLCNLTGLIFLFVLMLPIEDKSWMNWTLVGSIAICIPVFMLYREHYNRLDVDTDYLDDTCEG